MVNALIFIKLKKKYTLLVGDPIQKNSSIVEKLIGNFLFIFINMLIIISGEVRDK